MLSSIRKKTPVVIFCISTLANILVHLETSGCVLDSCVSQKIIKQRLYNFRDNGLEENKVPNKEAVQSEEKCQQLHRPSPQSILSLIAHKVDSLADLYSAAFLNLYVYVTCISTFNFLCLKSP